MPEPDSATDTSSSPVATVLAKAVTGLGGQQRDGQVQMATEVAEAM